MIDIKKIIDFFEKNYYISSKLLNYYTLIGINLMNDANKRSGQDIYTICLDGPPGSGKSLYAKLYAKMVSELLDENVTLISYQCDDGTSKIELFEDINVGAAVASEPEKVNIPGVLSRAIQTANENKKVVLFIDEYDKTREQVDSLFLQFLQDGVINTNQFGDLAIKEECKGNIQVIFCKNDFRTELTGPLTRRIRMITLDIIKPNDFHDLAYRKLYKDAKEKQDKNAIDLICLIYEEIYKNRNIYNRVCATSELFACIEDLTFLIKCGAPNNILFKVIIEDLFKNKDDAEIFMNKIASLDNEALKNVLTNLNQADEETPDLPVIEMLTKDLQAEAERKALETLKEQQNELANMQIKINEASSELDRKSKALDVEKESYKQKIDEFIAKIEQEFKEIVDQKQDEIFVSAYASNFVDSTSIIRRAQFIESIMKDCMEFGTLEIPLKSLTLPALVDVMITYGAIVYENGFYINGPFPLFITHESLSSDGKITFHFSGYKNLVLTKELDDFFNGQDILASVVDSIIKLNDSELFLLTRVYDEKFGCIGEKKIIINDLDYISSMRYCGNTHLIKDLAKDL